MQRDAASSPRFRRRFGRHDWDGIDLNDRLLRPTPMLQNVYRHPNEGFMPIGGAVSWTPPSIKRSVSSSSAIPKSFVRVAVPKFVRILADYSSHMARFDTVQACQVLDSSCSSSRSPMRSIMGSNHSVASDSCLTFENRDAWERLITPFLLLAAAEELSVGFAYLTNDESSTLVTGLYLRIQMELRKLKDVVCTGSAELPALTLNQRGPEQPGESSLTDEDSSNLLSCCIDCVMELCKVRCKFIDLQCLFFFHNRSNIAQVTTGMQPAAIALAQLRQSLDNTIQRIRTGGDLPVDSMMQSIKRELDVWQCLFETCAALERCAFAPTLMKLRQWQDFLKGMVHVDTVQGRWVVQSHRHIVSLLPVYFDRVYSFASPLYGFDTSKLWSDADTGRSLPSWDEHITQFLRQLDKTGSTAAMCLAFETSGLDTRPERGYQLGGFQEGKAEESANEIANDWQAMYLRSTIRLSQQSFAAPSPHASGTWSSQSSVLGTWRGGHLSNLTTSVNSPAISVTRKKKLSSVKHSPSFLNRKSPSFAAVTSSVLEYAPDVGDGTTWPHSIWEKLSSLLDEEKGRNTAAETLLGKASVLPAVRIYHVHERESDDAEEEIKPQLAGAKTTLFRFRWNEDHRAMKRPPANVSLLARKLPTRIHVASISDWLRLVFIQKGDHNGLTEGASDRNDNIRGFVADLALQLTPRSIFQSNFIANLLETKVEHLEFPLNIPIVDLSLELEGDEHLQDYAYHAQEAFGLRPVSPLFGESTRSRARSSGRYTPTSPRRQPRQPNKMDLSAISLFLGPELGRYL